MNDNSVNEQIAIGAIWMLALRIGTKMIALVSTVILARLLTPGDFGLVALAMSVYAMVELFRDFGFDTVLINKQKAGREYYDTAWTLQVIFSLFAATIIIALSSPFADLYGDERLLGVLWILALVLVINGFRNIGVVEFRKKMHFDKEFIYTISMKLSGFVVTIPLAYYLRTYWALILGMGATQLVSLVLSYKMQSFRPRFRITVWREIFGFSAFLYVNNVLQYLTQHGQSLIIGKLAGTSSLGIFSLSYEIASITSSEFVASINRAAYPGFAKLSDNIPELRATYLQVISHIVIIAAPSALGIYAIAPIMVPVLLGEKWLDAVTIIQLISIASLIVSISSCSVYIYLATSRQKITTIMAALLLIVYFSLLFALVPKYSIEGVAYAILLSQAVMLPIYQGVVHRILDLHLTSLITTLYRPFIAAVLMVYAINYYASHFVKLSLNLNGILILGGALLVGFTTYLSLLITFWKFSGSPEGPERRIASLIGSKIKRVSP